ncbi:MAG: glycine dehydrogenase (aminomethyl-transferring), partial [Phycisphaerales bacterium]
MQVSGGLDQFAPRHIGPRDSDIAEMLSKLGYSSLEELTAKTVPSSIMLAQELTLSGTTAESGEAATLNRLHAIASLNKVNRSFIGMGYTETLTPPVILRNILENPGWYTQYTPYQAE